MNKMKIQIAVTIMAIACVILSYFWNQYSVSASGQGQGKAPTHTANAPKVSVVRARPTTFHAQVDSFGTVIPVRQLNLSSDLSGRVIALSPNLKSGMTVLKGEHLATLDDMEYRQAVATAESDVATAELALQHQRQNQAQAKAEWERSGLAGQPESQLVLFGPQVKAAQAALKASQSRLKKAQADLKKTNIVAPFQAQIISSSVELGSYLNAGETLALLYGIDSAEVAFSLSVDAWRKLPDLSDAPQPWLIKLRDIETQNEWLSYVDRVEQHININNRQRSLVVRINAPLEQHPPLYPGTFVSAEIMGLEMDNVFAMPTSALTQNNELWYVDTDNLLQKVSAKSIFHANNLAYFQIPSLNNQRILSHPLNSLLPGMKVQVIEPQKGAKE